MASNDTVSLEVLEQRVAALEIGKQYDATKAAVQKVEEEYLLKLREIKAALVAEKVGGGLNPGVSGVPSVALSKELDELRKENDLLKQRNAKLEYRVQHLVSNMETLYTEAKESRKLSVAT